MNTELPTSVNKDEIVFYGIGSEEQYNIHINQRDLSMKAFFIEWVEDNWVQEEVEVSSLEGELRDYMFEGVIKKPITFRRLMTLFSFNMVI